MTIEYRSGSGTSYGFIVEWRLKPESVLLSELLSYDAVQKEWCQAPYSIKDFVKLSEIEANLIIRPYIKESYFGGHPSDVVDKLVGEAIIACLKTSTPYKMIAHIEWRLTRVCEKYSHKIEASEEQPEWEENGSFSKMIGKALEN